MVLCSYVPFPDKRLRRISSPVTVIDDKIKKIWQDMLDTMYGMPGVGLAACQIGFIDRLAVIDCSDTKSSPVYMANPEILHFSKKMSEYEEASPNLPGVWAKIRRPRGITVSYLDETGVKIEKDFVGLWSTSIQHQVDHLNGKMYFDHLSSMKRKMLLARSVKLAKKGR